VAGFYF